MSCTGRQRVCLFTVVYITFEWERAAFFQLVLSCDHTNERCCILFKSDVIAGSGIQVFKGCLETVMRKSYDKYKPLTSFEAFFTPKYAQNIALRTCDVIDEIFCFYLKNWALNEVRVGEIIRQQDGYNYQCIVKINSAFLFWIAICTPCQIFTVIKPQKCFSCKMVKIAFMTRCAFYTSRFLWLAT